MKCLRLIFVFIVFLTSCSKNCEECEQKLEMCIESMLIPIEPVELPYAGEQSDQSVSVIITEDERFFIEEKEYKFNELEKILKEMSFDLKTRKVKIKGSPSVKYRIIFNLLEMMKKMSLNLL